MVYEFRDRAELDDYFRTEPYCVNGTYQHIEIYDSTRSPQQARRDDDEALQSLPGAEPAASAHLHGREGHQPADGGDRPDVTASCFDRRFVSDCGSGSGKASIADHS